MTYFKRFLPFLGILYIFLTTDNKIFAQGIQFVHDIDSALALAKAQNKPIFIDFYTSWCGPCKVMTKDVFPQEKVGKYYNSQFINCKIQCDDNGKGVEVGKNYQVYAYPTLMFLNPQGELIHSMAGGLSAEEFIDLGNIARNPEKSLLGLLNQWNEGRRDTAFVNQYFKALKLAYRTEMAKSQFEEYNSGISQKEKTSKNTFELIKLLGFPPFSPMFSFVEENRKSYYRTTGKATIDKYLSDTYLWYLKSMAMGRGSAAQQEYRVAKAKYIAKKYPNTDEVVMFIEVHETGDTTGRYDVEEYMRRGTAFLDKYGKNNDSYTICLASLLGNFTGGENKGAAGITWMENLLARNPNPKYLGTYFYILWRNYHFDEAIAVGNKMKADAIKNNQPTKEIDDQITMVIELKAKKSKQKTVGI